MENEEEAEEEAEEVIVESEEPVIEETEPPETVVEEMELSSCAVVVLRKPRERARRGESLRRIRGDTIVASTWCKCSRW